MYLRMIALLFVAMYLQNQAFAQEEKNTQYQFKVYSNFEYESYEREGFYEGRHFSFGNITPSFVISKPRISHEIGISRFRIKHDDIYTEESTNSGGSVIPASGYKRTDFDLNIRYEYAFRLIKIKKHQLSIAASTEPYIGLAKSLPYTSDRFPVRFSALGNRLFMIPRAIFSLSDRLFLDINVPIEMMHLYRNITYTEDPSKTEEQRRFGSTVADFFDSPFRFRVGFGFNL